MTERNIGLVHLLSDLGANPAKPGAARGPSELMKFDETRERLFANYPLVEIIQFGDRSKAFKAHAQYIHHIAPFLENGAAAIETLLANSVFPFIMSGDHSNAAATIAAIRNFSPGKSLGVIWIDAHADIHTPYTTPSGNLHGMPVAISLGIDNQINARNDLDGQTVSWWQTLKQTGSRHIEGKIRPDGLLFVDIRDLEPEEWDFIHTSHIKYLTPEDRLQRGMTSLINSVIQFASGFDLLYVTFDIDSMDKQYVPGTGTPVGNGLSPDEASALLFSLWQMPNLAAFEITEINPELEREITIPNVYEVIKNMLA